jgi:enoyl-CoA hydratase/carnithine racemase
VKTVAVGGPTADLGEVMSDTQLESDAPTAPEDPVLSLREGSLLILTLNRPARLNAVSVTMYERLLAEIQAAHQDASIRCVVITGQGRAFCVGADLKSHTGGPPSGEHRKHYVDTAQQVNLTIQTGNTPVVAAVNGHAIGGGLEMALSADFMIVADQAKLRFPEVALGTFVGGGSVYTLAERVGTVKARELIYLGEFFSGAEAAEMGVAYRSAPTEDVMPHSLALARKLASKAPLSLAHAKRLIGPLGDRSRQEALRLEAEALEEVFGTQDWAEGVKAFHEKRPPNFTGE